MAEAFLRRVLHVHSCVQSDEDQRCIICLELCGTMNDETGLLELAIVLPCNHIVGSGCIAQWLHSNNTCPMCRHVFFPAPSRLHREYGIMGGPPGRARENQTRVVRNQISIRAVSNVLDYYEELSYLCDNYCAHLDLNQDTAHHAMQLVSKFLRTERNYVVRVRQNDSDDHILGVSIYVASHFTGIARSPREISAVIDYVDAREIREFYNLLADLRIFEDPELNGGPPRGNERTARESALDELADLCLFYSQRLCVFRDSPVQWVAQAIASRAWTLSPLHQTHRSPSSLAAACVCMAGHMVGSPLRMSAISQVSEVSDDDIAEVYSLLYTSRYLIVQEHWMRHLRRRDIEHPRRRDIIAMLPTSASG